MPLTGQVIDFYDDPDHGCLRKFASELDEWGSCEILSPEEHQGLSDDDFALVVLTKHANVLRKFPIHDDGHIKMAALYFDQNHTKLSAVEKVTAATHIREACDAHGIECPESVAKLAADGAFNNVVSEGAESPWQRQLVKQAAEELTKTASAEINARMEMPDGHYALVLEHDGDTVRKYAMPDGDHVKIASAYFDKYAMDLSPPHRHMFATNVMRRAGELEIDLGNTDHLQKWASTQWNSQIDYYLEQRKGLLPRNEEACDVLDKLASMTDETDPVTFAQALHAFDKETGLDRYYDKGVTDPWNSSMAAEKTAGWSEEIDGEMLTSSDLQKAAQSDKLRSHFGSTFRDQFKKHAVDVFNSLPDPDKVVIKQIAKGQI
jgi:hypothetical protein